MLFRSHNYDRRRTFITQQHYFTYQRKGGSAELELQIQFLQYQINDLATQVQNLTLGGGGTGGGGDDGIIGVI